VAPLVPEFLFPSVVERYAEDDVHYVEDFEVVIFLDVYLFTNVLD
jgi:hypothetical protein